MLEFWRRRTLTRHAFADRDWELVCERLPLLAGMTIAERSALRECATLFLADKIVAPSAGYTLDQTQRIEIAIGAALPV